MDIAGHLEKANHFVDAITVLDPVEDYETIIWARMHACTQWINGVLHAKDITDENWDISHTWYLDRMDDPSRLTSKIDDALLVALEKITNFERIRMSHVRGPCPYGKEILKESNEAYEHVEKYCKSILGSLDPAVVSQAAE
jgi:hypothetical protein